MAAVPYRQVLRSAWEGTEAIYSPDHEMGPEILAAIGQAVPDGAPFGFNHDRRRAWIRVSKPGDTRDVLGAAFGSLGRDLPAEPGED